MEKITINDLVSFRRRSDRSKKNFANNLKLREKIKKEPNKGGNYWICCSSTIINVFRTNNKKLLSEKIEELNDKIKLTQFANVKVEFQRNIDILTRFEDFNFEAIKPNINLNYIHKLTTNSILEIKGLPIQASPNHIFTFSISGSEEIGAAWFIAKLDGFEKSELGMFTDVLYRYLERNYSKEYFINTSFCVAVDIWKGQKVSYQEIEEGKVSKILDKTIDEILKL